MATTGDYGLLGGIAQGINSGLDAYNSTKQRNVENDYKKKQMDLLMRQAGYLQDPETGALQETPEHLRSRSLKEAGDEATIANNFQLNDEGTGLVKGEDHQPIMSDKAQKAQKLGLLKEAASMAEKGVRTKPGSEAAGLLGDTQDQLEQYVTPESEAKLKATANLANQRLDISRQGLDLRKENSQSMRDTRGERTQMAGNQQYNQVMKPTEDALLSANKAGSLVTGISNGTLKSTKQLSSDLSANLASLISGGRPATVFGMSHQDFDSAYKRVQNAYAMFSGETPNTMTQPQLKQVALDIKALQNEYGKQHEAKFNSFSSNMPSQLQDGLQKRFHTFRQGAGIEQESQQQGAGMMQPGGMMNPQQTSPQATPMPKVGELVDGMKYLGGDPANPKSWGQ